MATLLPKVELDRLNWSTILLATLTFWLSGCLILDFLIMPALYASGMMGTPNFAATGTLLFSLFNRLELLCAAIGVTGFLVLINTHRHTGHKGQIAIILSFILMGIVLVDTYGLTPEMTALGAQFNLLNPTPEIPATMDQMHEEYFALETLKLGVAGLLIGWCWRKQV